MFYFLLNQFSASTDADTILNFTYTRIVLAGLCALLMSILSYPFFIKQLQILSFGQTVRDDGPESHLGKKGTPTMGGLLLLFCVLINSLLWADLSHIGIWIVLFVMCGYGAIGFIDDFRKVKKNNTKGLSPRGKLIGQVSIGLIGLILYALNFSSLPFVSGLNFPHLFSFSLPWWVYLPFALFIIVGTSNGANLTDGLDGLAIGPVIASAVAFLLIFILGTNPHLVELSIFCAALIGASLGFLWFNAHPAAIFMGDVGSLALGGALATVAILSQNELISALLHGIFMIEVVSVILQVGSYKLRKKRIFKMAPLHHHFELSGWPETKVVIRFWIIAALVAAFTVIIKVWA